MECWLIDNGFGQSVSRKVKAWKFDVIFNRNLSAQRLKQLPSLWFVVCLMRSEQSNGSKVFSCPCRVADIFCDVRRDLWCFWFVLFLLTLHLACLVPNQSSQSVIANQSCRTTIQPSTNLRWVSSWFYESTHTWEKFPENENRPLQMQHPSGRCCILLCLRHCSFSSISFGRIRAVRLAPDSIWWRTWLQHDRRSHRRGESGAAVLPAVFWSVISRSALSVLGLGVITSNTVTLPSSTPSPSCWHAYRSGSFGLSRAEQV